MARRHSLGDDLASKVSRLQEVIMAQSGVDEFYEILRLILAKFYSEQDGSERLPGLEESNSILANHAESVSDILGGELAFECPQGLFDQCSDILGKFSIKKNDFSVLDEAFEQLTSRTYKSDKGQYFTPRHVVDMCVNAIDPKAGETICDPACGSGAFLISSHSYLSGKGLSASLYGFDYSRRAVEVARLASLIGSGSSVKINQIDSLLQSRSSLLSEESQTIEDVMGEDFEGFDVIVTNPPFAGDVSTSDYASAYDVARLFTRKIERDVLFVERCIRLLKPGGRMAIVLPDNKVSSNSFGKLRHWISKNAKINAVVSLHRYTFLPYTTQKAAVIFLTRMDTALSPYDSEVVFYRSDLPGKTSNGSLDYKKGVDHDLPPYLNLNHDLSDVADDLRKTLWNG